MVFEHEQLARYAADTRRQCDAWKHRDLCFLDTIERCRNASLRSRDVGSALEQLSGNAGGRHRRQRGERRRHVEGGSGIATDERFERTQRLRECELGLEKRVSKRLEIRV